MRLSRAGAAYALLVAVVVAPATSFAQADDSATLFDALNSSLPPGTHREAARLPTVRVGSGGDATIVFAIRSEGDDADATRQGALADTLTVLRTVYASPVAEQVTSVTVLGTFPFKSTKGRAIRENPVLRAVLTADRAAQLAWDSVTPADLPGSLDAWWLQGAFADAGKESRPVGEHDVALAHVDETLTALAEGDVPVARSQFKQFFDAWEDLDGVIHEQFPEQWAQLDAELERAEVALLHRQPEDLATAQAALSQFRAQLAALSP